MRTISAVMFKAPYITADIVRITAYIFKTLPALKFFRKAVKLSLAKVYVCISQRGKAIFQKHIVASVNGKYYNPYPPDRRASGNGQMLCRSDGYVFGFRDPTDCRLSVAYVAQSAEKVVIIGVSIAETVCLSDKT